MVKLLFLKEISSKMNLRFQEVSTLLIAAFFFMLTSLILIGLFLLMFDTSMNFKDASEVFITFFTMLPTCFLAYFGWKAKDAWLEQLNYTKSSSDTEKGKSICISIISEVQSIADLDRAITQKFSLDATQDLNRNDFVLKRSALNNHFQSFNIQDQRKKLRKELIGLLVIRQELKNIDANLIDDPILSLINHVCMILEQIKMKSTGSNLVSNPQEQNNLLEEQLYSLRMVSGRFIEETLKIHADLSKPI